MEGVSKSQKKVEWYKKLKTQQKNAKAELFKAKKTGKFAVRKKAQANQTTSAAKKAAATKKCKAKNQKKEIG